MITRDEAEQIVRYFLAHEFSATGDVELVINDSSTVERSYGWVFIPTAARYLQTGDPSDQFIGVGPLLVQREDGRLSEFSSLYSADMVLEKYEAGIEWRRPTLGFTRSVQKAQRLPPDRPRDVDRAGLRWPGTRH
jgi:hypothetical protein